ncbi:Emopamil-binding protein [Durotheca rogersii]|uniref:Emopamil-binding protein n=1 Tax=Durotheca rogersii TaxID=419775 RepID=UPI00221E5D11|nr:Emopamil-binding protein [Durotheca rogersii]KAI5862930.1 Emopamil-binding protein [Durotheca rogersii]
MSSSATTLLRSSLPPDLFDQTTLVSLASTVAILGAAYAASLAALPPTPTSTRSVLARHRRALFVWHAFDALIHFALEGGFLYHCFFSWTPLARVANPLALAPTPLNYLGHRDARAYGPQAAAPGSLAEPLARLWMVYAKADRRWAGADLSVISLELLTVFVAGPLAVAVCAALARGSPRASVLMLVVATMELYGGWVTFCPEWLTASGNLDTANPLYLWVYLVFFNGLWVALPLYAAAVAAADIADAFAVRARAEAIAKRK